LSIQDCNEASLILGGLSVWVLGRAFPDSPEWSDRDALQVRACRALRATVTGTILRSDEIADLLAGMEAMHIWESKAFDWTLREPNLAMHLRSPHGGLTVEADIMPDHMMQRHQFRFRLDLTYLLEPIAQCRQILASFPVTVGGRSHSVKISNRYQLPEGLRLALRPLPLWGAVVPRLRARQYRAAHPRSRGQGVGADPCLAEAAGRFVSR
jgi:hypothetical protein